MKLLGIQIAGGYSSEARVFASLLGQRGHAYEALVFHQESPTDTAGPAQFEADSQAAVQRVDFGWRPSPPGGHSLSAKIYKFARLRSMLPRLIRLARKYDPDVIYSNQQHWDCYVATHIAEALKKTQIIHLHYIVGPWLHHQPLSRLRTCHHVVVVSDFIHVQALKHGVPSERVTTILNAMPLPPHPQAEIREAVRADLGVPAQAPLIGIVARLSPGKGQDDTLDAFSQIAGRFPEAQLMIVGDGETRAALEAQAQRLGLKERVLFTGRRSDVPRILASLDIFCHPSRMDPCPLAVLEASAAGLPVIAYAEGGACETILDGKTGYLVPVEDKAGLTRAMTDLVGNPEAARSMGAAGRRHIAENFQPAVAATSFAVLIERAKGYSE